MRQIKIGEYTINEPESDGDYWWIVMEDGEGMGTTEEKLIKLIKDFYAKEF